MLNRHRHNVDIKVIRFILKPLRRYEKGDEYGTSNNISD